MIISSWRRMRRGSPFHGTEVKSLRMGKCSIKEAFIRVENEEVFIYGMHISLMRREISLIKIRCA